MAKKLNWEKVHRSHMNGMSIQEIATKLDMSASDVRRIFSTKKLPISSNEDRRFIEAFELYKKPCATLDEIAQITGINAATLTYNFKKLGLRKSNNV